MHIIVRSNIQPCWPPALSLISSLSARRRHHVVRTHVVAGAETGRRSADASSSVLTFYRKTKKEKRQHRRRAQKGETTTQRNFLEKVSQPPIFSVQPPFIRRPRVQKIFFCCLLFSVFLSSFSLFLSFFFSFFLQLVNC